MSVLPPNATELELTLEETAAARLAGVATPLAEALDPRRCPPAFLPFLAFGRDVALWRDGWTETVKREAVADEYRLKRRCGTPAGIVGRLAYVPRARLVDIVKPPAGFFAGQDYSQNEREWAAWAAGLPVLEIFPRRTSEAETGGGYATGRDAPDRRLGPEAFLGAESGEATWFAGAPLEEPWQARMVDGDETTPLAVRAIADQRRGRDGEVFEVSGQAAARDGVFVDEFWDGACADGAGRPFYRRIAYASDRPSAKRPADSLVTQSEKIQDAGPLVRAPGGWDGLGVFADDAFAYSFVDADDLLELVLTWRVVDGPFRAYAGAAFTDHDRFGLPDHTAELVIELAAGPCRDAFFADADSADAAFAGAAFDGRALDAACEAVDAARAGHEDLLIDLNARGRLYRDARSLADLQL